MPKSRARVFTIDDPSAVKAFTIDSESVRNMVLHGVTAVTGEATEKDAWLSLVTPMDVIGIKVHSGPGPLSGTRPSVVAGVVQGLIQAGISPSKIVVWDRNLRDLQAAGFEELRTRFGIRVEGAHQAGYDAETRYENEILGKLVYGDLLFGSNDASAGRYSHVSKLVASGITKIISISPLLNNHNIGVAGHLWGLSSASVDNFRRFESDPTRLAIAIPEIYAMEVLSDRVVLNITDALIAQYQGTATSLMHYASTLNQLWFSRDPVALDVLSVKILSDQKAKAGVANPVLGSGLFDNASLLELGLSNYKMIDLIPVDPNPRAGHKPD